MRAAVGWRREGRAPLAPSAALLLASARLGPSLPPPLRSRPSGRGCHCAARGGAAAPDAGRPALPACLTGRGCPSWRWTWSAWCWVGRRAAEGAREAVPGALRSLPARHRANRMLASPRRQAPPWSGSFSSLRLGCACLPLPLLPAVPSPPLPHSLPPFRLLRPFAAAPRSRRQRRSLPSLARRNLVTAARRGRRLGRGGKSPGGGKLLRLIH